jgi:hypothetical protein
MAEKEVIEITPEEPATVATLTQGLTALRVVKGSVLLHQQNNDQDKNACGDRRIPKNADGQVLLSFLNR